jgi:anti-sigma B factor antagonist
MSAQDPTHFAISCHRLGARSVVVTPSGSLDLASAPKLKWALFDLLDEGRDGFVVDLSLVSFIDSTALGVLIGFKRSLGSRGRIVIAAPSPEVVTLLEVAGVTSALDLLPTVEAAVTLLGEPGTPSPEEDRDAVQRAVAYPRDAGVSEEAAGDGAEAEASDASLTPDAAMALGIAASAMPFARSSAEQVERWLRVLCRCGDAASVLTSLGITDELPVAPGDDSDGPAPPSGRAVDRDPVSTVTRAAGVAARRRGASGIRPSDLLEAVIAVYGPEFEHVLRLHGVSSADVTERLRELRADS